jgi:hypothetical protein
MSRHYRDFDVEFLREGEGWVTRIRSPRGEARGSFTMPLSDQEIRLMGLTVVRGRRATRSVPTRDVEEVKDYGRRLFEALFQGSVLESFRENLLEIRGDPEIGLRIRLRLSEAPELATVPWEFLYDRRLNRFLALDDETPIVRYLDLPFPAGPLEVRPPLRILVMISSPRGVAELDVEEEWALLNQALGDLIREGSVVLHRLERATLAALRWRLKDGNYHVFHFIGHGGMDTSTERGVLVLEDDQSGPDVVEAETIAGILGAEKTLRLAVLNACEGGRASGSDIFAGTAQTLVQQDLPAVLAMQFEITDEAAITLTHDFYKALAYGDLVDAALTEARRGLRFVKRNPLEWGTPVLYMRSGDGKLFDVHGDPSPPALETLPPPEPPAEAEAETEAEASPEDPHSGEASHSAGQGVWSETESRVARLLHESQLAVYGERWKEAEACLEEILREDPGHEEARARLEGVRKEEHLSVLYASGLRHQEAGRHEAALQAFLKVRELGGDYRGVEGRIAACREGGAATPESTSPLTFPLASALTPLVGNVRKRTRSLLLWSVGLLLGLGGLIALWESGYDDWYDPTLPIPPVSPSVITPGELRFAPDRDLEAAIVGLGPDRDPLVGGMVQGEKQRHSLFLDGGVRYVIAASCDAHCSDLDLELTWNGGFVAEARDVNPLPSLDFIPTVAGLYDLDVEMYACSDGPCTYRVQVYR